MEITVIGAGAIGALVAGYLNQQEVNVTLVGKARDAAAIREKGLTITGVRGSLVSPVKVSEEPPANTDLAILAVKMADIAPTLKRNAELIKEAPVVSVQNGVRAAEIISGFIPAERVIDSIVMFGATYHNPGSIVHNFEGDWVIGGAFSNNNSFIEKTSEVLSKAFPVKVTERIREMKWLKLFLNLNNCLPALVGKSIQETFTSLEMAGLAMRLWREALAAVNRADITLESLPDFPLERLLGLTEMPLGEASQIYSKIMINLSQEPLYGSILQSIRRGRPSEVDYINGEIANLGDKTGMPAPLNTKIVEMLHQVEETGRFFPAATVLAELGR